MTGRIAAARGLLVPGILAVVLIAVFVSLGNWQVRRLAWKEGLIAAVAERAEAAPVAAPGPDAWPGLDLEAWRFRPVELRGRFGGPEAYVWTALTRPKGPLGGPGYWVMQPFTTEAGWSVIVNRGFVPDNRKDPAARPGSTTTDAPVTIVGRVREPEAANFFSPAPDIDERVWYVRDRTALAGAFGLADDEVAPYLLDLTARMTPPGGLPQAGETRMTFPNNHLQYALTWYGLALALAGVFATFAWRRLSGEEPAQDLR